MGIATSFSRFADYYRRHGFRATLRRAGVAAKRALFSSRMVLYYCELTSDIPCPAGFPDSPKVKPKRAYSELSPQDLEQIVNVWNPEMAHRNIKQRFARGASLWLITLEDRLAGYGWTLRGRTIEPHYFPLGEDDVHLFDFHVFPRFRGHGLNPLLVTQILRSLAADCQGRAFIEAAEWNQAQLSSLRKTPFRRLGAARKVTVFGSTFVWWDGAELVCNPHPASEPRSAVAARRNASDALR